jgi:hypothetical protein
VYRGCNGGVPGTPVIDASRSTRRCSAGGRRPRAARRAVRRPGGRARHDGSPGAAEVAQVRLAQARWALGTDRPGAIALARQARARLAALPFPSDELPRLERWLASARSLAAAR